MRRRRRRVGLLVAPLCIFVCLSLKASRHVSEVTFEAVRSRTHWARRWACRAGLTAGSTALTYLLGSLAFIT